MKEKSSIPSVFTVLQVLLILLCRSAAYKNFVDESSILYTNTRVPEVENHCAQFLTSASKSFPDVNGDYIYTLIQELSFTNGDWEQENGAFPLMPFDESDLPHRDSDPLKLVSFLVKDMNLVHHYKNASVISLGGILSIGITRNTTFFPSLKSPSFHMMPGFSILTMVFEGVYFESGEDRLLCLLGNTVLPISVPFVEHWDFANSQKPHLLQDDQVFLVLRYPQTFNLTSRAIKGEIRSLNQHGSLKYFDNVQISSQLSRYSKYQFSPELMQRSCDSDMHFCEEEWAENDVLTFGGSEFCKTIRSVVEEPFNAIANYKLNDWRSNYEDFRLLMQQVICEEENTNMNMKNARISATLRLFPASIPADTEKERTCLSSLTLLAEGTWDSSSGKLCMIGCQGAFDPEFENCNYQIFLFFPRVYSIKQRSLMLGRISSSANETNMFFPMLIKYVPRPVFLHLSLGLCSSYLSYNYSMIQLATSIRRRNQPSRSFPLLKKSLFLKYPALELEQDPLSQLRLLFANLNFDAYATSSNKHNSRVFIHMDVFSLGPLFGPYNKPEDTEKITDAQILNVSMHLIFNEGSSVFTKLQYRDLSPLFLEGVYDPQNGQMYLIGCRMVPNASTNVLDCLVEVKVQYPPETGRWLKNPSVKMTITSQRNETDPLHFNSITLTTDIIPYLKHQDDMAFRILFERVLRILISFLLVGIIFSQLSYMNRNISSVSHISLVMVAEQILGYGAELLRDTEILFDSKASETYKNFSRDLDLTNALEIAARIVMLVALVLTVRLYQKVSQARKRQNAHGSSKAKRKNKNFVLSNLKAHFVICLVLSGLLAIELSMRNDLRSLGLIDALLLPFIMIRQVQIHVLWAQDFFLVPQAFENYLRQWHYSKFNPLSKYYYVGLTFLRLILRFYDYIRDPILSPYSDNGDFNRMSSDFFSIYSNNSIAVAVPIIMVVVAVVIHIQQSHKVLKSFSFSC